MRKNLRVKQLLVWLLTVTMLLGSIPQGISLKDISSIKNMSKVQAVTTLKNPKIVRSSYMDSEQTVTWDCVWFGSYPQSEVTARDGAVYDKLKNATNWDNNNDIMIEGTKYRRLKGEDATRATFDEEGFYDWNGSYTTYHYFKYEPIKWRVLNTDGKEAFLFADVALDDQLYSVVDSDEIDITWEVSMIRSWLNGYDSSQNEEHKNYSSKNFINLAFSEKEQNAINKVTVINDDSIDGVKGGNDTNDKIYLLSEKEVCDTDTAKKYGFVAEKDTEDEARRSNYSDYTYAMGAGQGMEDNDKNLCSWWLRSPSENDVAMFIEKSGFISDCSWGYNLEIATRPVLNINLSNVSVYSYAGTVSSDGAVNEVEYDGESQDGDSYEIKDYEDYNSEVKNFMDREGTRKAIQYLCRNENFPNSIYVYKNDATFGSNVTMVISDAMYRKMDGWRDLYNSSTSIEEAEKVIAALLQEYQEVLWDVETQKTRRKYADAFVSGLKGYIKANAIADSIDTKDIKVLESIVTEDTVSKLYLQGNYDKLSKYFQEKGGYSENSAIVRSLNRYAVSKEIADATSNAMDMAGTVIDIQEVSKDTLNYYCQLEAIIHADVMYTEMLTYIKDNCYFDVVKQAAQNLYDVIQGGWQKQLGYVMTAAKNKVVEEAMDLVIKQAIKASPWLELIKASYDWGKNLSNIIYNIEDIQKQKDNMRIIAYLGDVLKKWVIDNQTKYLNSDVEEISIKGKNIRAKRLYYSMYMLWRTRIVGEQTLQEMIKKSYSMRSKYYVSSIHTLCSLNAQENVIFSPDTMKMFMSISVACPVDVEVYDKNGKLLLTVKDGKESSGCQSGIYYYVKYHPIDRDYVKVLCYPEDADYTLKYVGKSSGRVDSAIMEVKADGTTRNSFFDNVSVKKDDSIIVKGDSKGNYSYRITDVITGQEKEQLFNTDVENNYISIQQLKFLIKSFNVTKGDEQLLTLTVLPENASNQKLVWESSDISIASVNSDGVVYGKAEGIVTITAYSQADEISTSCTVQVVKKKETSTANTRVIKLSKIKLKGLSNKVAAGKKLKLTATVFPATANNKKLLWKSSNPKVATVTQAGVVTLKKKSGGKKALITASATDGSGAQASWKVTSMKGIVKKVKLTGTKQVKAGKSVKLKVTVKATKKANKKLFWTSSNTKYATVNAKGVVKTKKTGKGKKVKITAMATDGSGKKATITIKIK